MIIDINYIGNISESKMIALVITEIIIFTVRATLVSDVGMNR